MCPQLWAWTFSKMGGHLPLPISITTVDWKSS
jgi:hypothetical protein